MVKKVQKKSSSSKKSASNGPLSSAVRDSAQQIWLAGLGAFSKAQEEGGKVFETLVKEGVTLQRKTQAVAEDRINEASTRVSSMANDISSKAQGQWDKLETIFEERVAKALGKLGVPSARDIDELMDRVEALTAQVTSLGGVPVTPKKAPARKAAGKKAPARKRAASPSATAKKTSSRKTPARKRSS
ncbi:phasin family protein [Hydrogenophaga sp. 5NK40-0174]|uniref:phasin family protein n=1 Tax=Hydrogenophaga sp. 5NK40-0174 TaxID=3127649 RepID=UPI003108BD12